MKTGKDWLKPRQMLRISVLTALLGGRIEIARVIGDPKSYRGVWLGLIPLHPEEVVQL